MGRLVFKGSWKKPQAFTCFDGWPRQHDTGDPLFPKSGNSCRNCQVGFAGSGRTDRKYYIVPFDRFEVVRLSNCSRDNGSSVCLDSTVVPDFGDWGIVARVDLILNQKSLYILLAQTRIPSD